MDERRLLEIIKQRSRVFDVETAGREVEEHALIEGGVLNLKTGKLKRTVFKPGLRRGGDFVPFTKKEFEAHLSPWARNMMRQETATETAGPWAGFMSERKAAPAEWLEKNVLTPVKQGEWLWAHNARFDLKFLAANVEPQAYEDLVATPVGRMLKKTTRNQRKLYVTAGDLVHEAQQSARRNPERAVEFYSESWDHFKTLMAQAAENKRQGLFVDTQYVMQVAMAEAQQAGIVKRTGDVFTGTSLEAFRKAWGGLEFSGAPHTVAPDVRATADILNRYIPLIQDIRSGKGLAPEQKLALRFHSELQPRLFPENFRTQLLEAKKDLLTKGEYELYWTGGQKVPSYHLRDLLGIYKERRTTFGYKADIESVYTSVKDLNVEQIEASLLEKDSRVARIMERAWEAANQPETREINLKAAKQKWANIINPIRNRPALALGLGVAALVGAYSLAPARKKDRDPTSERDWLRQQMLNPDQYASLVQRMNKQKIGHHRMNGY